MSAAFTRLILGVTTLRDNTFESHVRDGLDYVLRRSRQLL
jgi:hypothetical protein